MHIASTHAQASKMRGLNVSTITNHDPSKSTSAQHQDELLEGTVVKWVRWCGPNHRTHMVVIDVA